MMQAISLPPIPLLRTRSHATRSAACSTVMISLPFNFHASLNFFIQRDNNLLSRLQPLHTVQIIVLGYIVHKLTAITILILLVHITPGNLPQRLSFAYGVCNQRLLITREQKTMCSNGQLCGAVTGQKDKT